MGEEISPAALQHLKTNRCLRGKTLFKRCLDLRCLFYGLNVSSLLEKAPSRLFEGDACLQRRKIFTKAVALRR